ncbi:unnamed protein product [Zymoseptoria tritici ST99CH_1A5]|uniref:Uncharacterized protein n=1 Tax=Zymoseptoria tritici ST99CH_1A5 TaxID=1276529 RepID=A0A1Y6LWZ1_ZYMTR|nr:unnamed protein product [Zymoseptoria tritici ST99CH_1A5]
MLRLFRSISRGRRKKDDNNNDVWSPFAASPERSRHRTVGQNAAEDYDDEAGDDDDDEEYSPRRRPNTAPDYFQQEFDDEVEDEDEEDEDDEDAVETPLLPIFSAPHLDRLPLYNITHAIRLLIVQRCETTLSWDQLRSPQISQFLVKPIQGQIRADHFNRATLCALIANCLQFQKEGQAQPGNVGVSKTRAAISELLAMRLLREFSTRELIDSLSYDFDPLQGIMSPPTGTPPLTADLQARRSQGRVARVSTIEIAIRAEAKRFLAHPLVVQHLEAIWAGTIVFHSEADNLHRRQRRPNAPSRGRSYGTSGDHDPAALPAGAVLSRKSHASKTTKMTPGPTFTRRTVTLYNPREASLFKLSRLRVPRYRQVFSTLSFATMLGLFIAVLVDRSIEITPLEVLFWFWSIGYMLDEVVGFTEQGFGLYILSFWNAFDLGILGLFVAYYCLRLYGVVIAEQGKHRIASLAYDVLASTAILLFPRLFSVLDHYRYFSQLLIAFRLMAQDLMAVLVLIVICCSGFFVALSLSFADEKTDAGGVAYSLFQILMGFTPAVWDRWDGYNLLGKAIMSIFLTICHFLIVTILITVLTNSFMAIVKNAEEEHQFLFAVNTISMVKSDALFSYVAPTNIIGWALSPFRFLMPLRQYVRLNRTIIKATHFPILFVIFSYERMIMARTGYAPTELIERTQIHQKQPAAFSKAPELYTPNHRLREPSVISFRKDRALDEVFRRPFRGDTVRTTTREMEQDGPTAVDKWMHNADIEGGASPPMEQPRSVLERLEHRRPTFKRAATAERLKIMQSRDFSTATKSVASDGERRGFSSLRRPFMIEEESEIENSTATLPHDTEADGDDEINDESDSHTPGMGESAVSIKNRTAADDSESEYFHTPAAPLLNMSHAARARLQASPDIPRAGYGITHLHNKQPRAHKRQASGGTMIFAPQVDYDSSVSNPKRNARAAPSRPVSGGNTGTTTPARALMAGASTPLRKMAPQVKPRPIAPTRQQTAPATRGLTFMDTPRQAHRNPSFNARALDLASEIGDNKWGPSGGGIDAGGISGFPASFSEQMMRERDLQRQKEEDRRRTEDEEKGMVNRIMLARMHTLEEGFREVLKEIKDMTQNANSGSRRDSEAADSAGGSQPIGVAGGRHTKPLRPKIEPAVTGSFGPSGSGWQAPKTPIGRIGGNDAKSRKSPRKTAVRTGKKDRPLSGGGKTASTSEGDFQTQQLATQALAREQMVGGVETASPDSVLSVIEIARERDEAAAGLSTAVTDEELKRDNNRE